MPSAKIILSLNKTEHHLKVVFFFKLNIFSRRRKFFVCLFVSHMGKLSIIFKKENSVKKTLCWGGESGIAM